MAVIFNDKNRKRKHIDMNDFQLEQSTQPDKNNLMEKMIEVVSINNDKRQQHIGKVSEKSEVTRSLMPKNTQSMMNSESDESSKKDIDYGLYSRQVYALGKDVMINMSKTNVLVSGMDGLGVEIAKNLILGGFKCVDIHDTLDVTLLDLSTQYYFDEKDVGKKRTECCLKSLSELNSYVNVSSQNEQLTEELLKKYSIVVLVNQPLDLIIECSKWARNNNIKFIVGNTSGLLGQIFCDFGDEFISNDPTGDEPQHLLISHITDDGYVTMLDGKRHGLVDGDYVSFPLSEECKKKLSTNMSPPLLINITSPDCFHITDTIPNYLQLITGTCVKVNMPMKFQFLSYLQSLITPKFVCGNFAKYDKLPLIHLAFYALKIYHQKYQSYPKPHNLSDARNFIQITHEINESNVVAKVDKIDDEFLEIISMQSFGQFAPIQAIIGGIAAQEVIKASSNKYTPINQWLYFDSLELITNNDTWKNMDPLLFDIDNTNIVTNSQCNNNIRSLGQIAIFGREFQKNIEYSSAFVVGAGAIGCELLKNLVLMGVASDSISNNENKPTLHITDMDTIELSNLSRQFLFRNNDIGKMKAEKAALAVTKINPCSNIKCYTLKVGEESENIFNSKFYKNIDCILNALDNVDARIHMDKQSISHNIPMIDAGTLGTMGNVQVIIPHITESYSSFTDPEESSIPVCTLKHFPYLIEHTIQWARDHFEGIFKNAPETAINFMNDKNYIDATFNTNNFDYIEAIKNVYNYVNIYRPSNYENCLEWARNLFDEYFVNPIQQLLYTFPPDHLGSYGQPFWVPPKRCPKIISFDIHDKLHFNFILSTANLLAYMYNIPIELSNNFIIKKMQTYTPPKYVVDESAVIHENEQLEEERLKSNGMLTSTDDKVYWESKYAQLKQIDFSKLSFDLKSIDFEKDDDTNFHMQFITSCANLRANNYSIPNVDIHKAKFIAGKIIPAIATTTAVVAGLQCIEYLKVIAMYDKINYYQNSYLNLALSLVATTEPFPPKYIDSVNGKFTLWDKVIVNEMNIDNRLMTVSDLISFLKDRYNLGSVCMINFGKRLIFAEFMKSKDEKLNLLVRDAIIGPDFSSIDNKEFVMLECLVEDLGGEDVDIPMIKFIFSK